ncbi:MAG: N-carbamoyl-D-amino-acid hydrolase [bacterium]|nr:N-carbamoyl-D-amino-acid hydrolase [bacterium]
MSDSPRSYLTSTNRQITVGAAQLGPIARDESRAEVVERLVDLLHQAAKFGCDLVVYPELALTTFFPRWWIEDPVELNSFYETEMPSPVVRPLFDEAARLGIGFCLGYAELTADGHRYNTYLLVDGEGKEVAKFRKVHIPGHETHEPQRPFQHLERAYFEPASETFRTWTAFRGEIGLALCNDRRWPETYRVMGLADVEMILIGYNTPIHYYPDPSQDFLAGFHNRLVMQAGAYQNGTFVVGVAKGGVEEGVESLAESCIIGPSGEVLAQAVTDADELVVSECNLNWCTAYKNTLYDFSRYRRPEMYKSISEQMPLIADEPQVELRYKE